MVVHVMFHKSSTPKIITDAVSVYTKGSLVCVQKADGWILKWPDCSVFQLAHKHGDHVGSGQEKGGE